MAVPHSPRTSQNHSQNKGLNKGQGQGQGQGQSARPASPPASPPVPDPWDPWTDEGPRLRADSFTAKQLSYLSPEAVHLESRRLFIGDFPHGWVEQNCRTWMAAVCRSMERLESMSSAHENEHEVEFEHDLVGPHADIKEPDTSPLTQIVPESALKLTGQLPRAPLSPLTAIEHSQPSLMTREEQEMVNEISQASFALNKKLRAQRRTIADKRRHLHTRFRHKPLREAPMEVVGEPSSHVAPARSQASVASSTISSDRTRVAPNFDAASTTTATVGSAKSVQTTYYDCEEDVGRAENKEASTKPLVSIADPPVASVHAPADSDSQVTDSVAAAADAGDKFPGAVNTASRTETSDATDKLSQNDRQSIISLPRNRKFADLRRRAHVRFSNRRHRKLVYQGRYLVEIRESTAAKPVISETDAPLATTLVSRWKEYAVFAKYTGNVHRPLSFYFYDVVKDAKLTRRAKRAWSRSLDFKVTVDPFYELKIFSPLDLTLALWKPQTRSGRGRERKRKTKIIILHAQSILNIWNISFLLGSVIQSAGAHKQAHRRLNVGVPSMDVEVQLMIDAPRQPYGNNINNSSGSGSGRGSNNSNSNSNSNSHHHHQNPNTITYDELKKPLVATSPTVKLIVEKVWDAVHLLPRRYNVSNVADGCKFALAWQQSLHSHRQLWVPGMADEMIFLSRLFWLMQPCGGLSLLVPEPKCYEGDLVEPPPVEGYCMSINRGGNGKGISSMAKYTQQQYLSTHDYMMFYMPETRAQPPMLASSQQTLEKSVDPFPLDENGDIKWIKGSTCLRELDFHDAVARLELERRIDMISHSRGFIDLRYIDEIFANGDVAGQVVIQEAGNCQYKLQFSSESQAKSWEKHLNEVVKYWRSVHSAELLRRTAGTNKPMSITPYLANRPVLYSGPLFFKKHRFTTFKRRPVILTLQGLVVYRIDESTRQAVDPNSPTPAAAYDFRHYETFSLEDSYIYTGQLARHALLDNDKHIDPNNPGVRALPRAYEDSWVSQDTELDRCFVVWRPRVSHLQRVFRTSGTGSYLTFLARDKHERDHWVTAIRYVQSELASKSREEVASEEFCEADLVDISLDNSSKL